MASATALPNIPEIGITFSSSTLACKAFAYSKQHHDKAVHNHAVRAPYWALTIAQKLPEFSSNTQLNLEAVVVGCILHDMGWAKTSTLFSSDKRFEVDGANVARDFIRNAQASACTEERWDEGAIKRIWDAIALHTTASIARHAAPEVSLTHPGVVAKFMGASLCGPNNTALITTNEYHESFPSFGIQS